LQLVGDFEECHGERIRGKSGRVKGRGEGTEWTQAERRRTIGVGGIWNEGRSNGRRRGGGFEGSKSKTAAAH
jgi:hypothetical protein